MNSDFWFYTLSAIPQTLAATIALAATFIVFRLTFIEEKIVDVRKDLKRFILLLSGREIQDVEQMSNEDLFSLYQEVFKNIKPEDKNLGLDGVLYDKLRVEMQRIIHDDWRSYFRADQKRISEYLNAKKNIFGKLLQKRKTSIGLLIRSLFITTVTIVVSLVALPNYQNIDTTWLIIYVTLFGAVASVVSTATSIWIIAKN